MFKKFILAAVLALSLGACAPIGKFIEVATTTVTNPISTTNISQTKLVYASTLEAVVTYRRYCWSKPWDYIVGNAAEKIDPDPIMKPICEHRRSVLRAIQAADDKAFAAIGTADNFVRNNPTLNAANVIGAAWAAVNDFQSLTARTAVVAAK